MHAPQTDTAAIAWPFVGLQVGYYGAIAVDAPSHFKARTALQMQNWKSRRDVEKHYRTMSFEQLAALPVGVLGTKDAHLFIWSSGPFIPQALQLIEAWGFRYSTRCFTWLKLKRSLASAQPRLPMPFTEQDLHVGLGLTVRHQSECVLLGRRGNARRNAKDVREIIIAPVREHSRKPDEFFRRVERYCSGPYLELFARERRPNWDAWGDEADKFNGGDR